MRRLTYSNFDLVIERAGDAAYRARVTESPAGQATSHFELPFSETDLEILMLRVGRRSHVLRRQDSSELQAIKTFGGTLFERVFSGEVRAVFRSSYDRVTQEEDGGLRLRLRFLNTPELADLPWEFLYYQELNRFLSLSTSTPLIRYIELPEAMRSFQVAPPLRVLVVISSPTDYESLNVEREWSNLNEALSNLIKRQLVTLDRLDPPALRELRPKLRQVPYHVFHFIGHGRFDSHAEDGELVLQNDYGRGKPVNGQRLGALLSGHHSLRLAILNACEGARGSRMDPFAGVAQSLVQQGIPAVIAMQFEVTDEAAITFSHEFYLALTDGYLVDAALAEARCQIYAQGNDLEWGTPVLYMRSPDGAIFSGQPVSQVDLPPPNNVVTTTTQQATEKAPDAHTASSTLLQAENTVGEKGQTIEARHENRPHTTVQKKAKGKGIQRRPKIEKKQIQAASTDFIDLPQSGIKWDTDATRFPMVFIEPTGLWMQALPITKRQYSTFTGNIQPIDSVPNEVRVQNTGLENHFITGISFRDAQEYASWCGESYFLPDVEMWRQAFNWLAAQPSTARPSNWQELSKPALKLWEKVWEKTAPRTLLDQTLMAEGVLEWAMNTNTVPQRPGGMGKPFRNLWQVLRDPTDNPVYPRSELTAFGFRLFRRRA